ncbi:hypothetical protein EDD11_007381 [Mortierella claussenii]|nr:hypothetical protein EDD11_007381 [Mortierella claussenii]
MTNVTDFRPVAHEFYPEHFHGAAYVGTKTADAPWFYRFDSTFIEVRDILTCRDHVYASLSINEIKQRFSGLLKGSELRFVNVQNAYVGEFHALIVVVREVQEDRDHVFIWNLLTFHLQLLVSPPRLLTAVTVMAQQAIMVRHRLVKSWGKVPSTPSSPTSPTASSSSSLHRPLISNYGSWSSRSSSSSILLQGNSHINGDTTSSSIDLDREEEEHDNEDEDDMHHSRSRIQNNRRQLLVLGHRSGWVTLYRFTVSLTGQEEAEHQIALNTPTDASVTSLATLSNKNTESIPVIVAGMSDAKAYVINYHGAHKKPQVLMALKDLRSKNLPITSITLQPTKDEALDILVVGQGYSHESKSNQGNGERPTVTIYYLRAQRSEYRLLGHVEPQLLEGEIATGGKTLAIAVSEDNNGLRIQCAFSIQVDQVPLRSELTTVEIFEKEVRHLDHVEMLATEGGTLLDISPLTNSYELLVLHLSKMVNYVHTADIEWNRKESEWVEGVEGQERVHRDLAPSYGSFFEEKAKFNYTDSELAETEERRRLLGGKLFYDRLLEFVELETGVLYPPRNHAQQRNLWTNIFFNGNLNTDNRTCLAYYLLKNQHNDASEQFLKEYMVPPQFVDLMNGFWALDHFEFKKAVLYLSRPGLTVDWVEDVIEAIHEFGSAQLSRQFLIASGLNLESDRFVDLKMKILLETEFTEAFYFQRSKAFPDYKGQSEQAQDTKTKKSKSSSSDLTKTLEVPAKICERLFVQLLDYTFLDKPNRKAIQALAILTMNEAEEHMFVRYCDTHSGLTREVGQEFLIMYFVNHSRYMEAIRMHRKLLSVELEKEDAEQFHREALERRNSRQQFGANDESAKTVSKDTMTKSQKRQVLIDNLMMVLPATQRALLDIEDDQQGKGGDVAGGAISTATSGRSNESIRGVVRSLVTQTDGPYTSLKGMDLNWVTRALSHHILGAEVDLDDQEEERVQDENQIIYAPAHLLADSVTSNNNNNSNSNSNSNRNSLSKSNSDNYSEQDVEVMDFDSGKDL